MFLLPPLLSEDVLSYCSKPLTTWSEDGGQPQTPQGASSFVTSADRGGRTLPLKSCITNDFTDKRKFHTIDMNLLHTLVSINLYCLQNTDKMCEYDSQGGTKIEFCCRHHKLIDPFVWGRFLPIVGKYLVSMKTFVMRDSSGDLG